MAENQQITNERQTTDEAYRRLRATIKFAKRETPLRTVLVVDVDRDAPSLVARDLAAAFVNGGDPCVHVDAHIRGSVQQGPGLADLISGSLAVDELRGEIEDGGVTIGPGHGASPDILMSERLRPVLDALAEKFRFVIISCAPLPQYGDALGIAPRVDGVILTVGQGRTRRTKAIDARDALERIGAPVLGFVMIEGPRRWF